jgi:hypothetical protein
MKEPMKELNVVITMDCEPTKATSHPSATGPTDWEMGQEAVEGYAAIARQYGFPVTFFVHPETALAQADVFQALEQNGCCLGLHMHPWKFAVWRYGSRRFMGHYGGLSSHAQRELLSEAAAIWHGAIGYRPQYFRPGTFSGNDRMFGILAELGFAGGSCSAPGRVMPEMQAVWYGAEPDIHYTHPEFRHIRGELPFINMPLSADFSRLLEGKVGRKMHPDFRPDVDWLSMYGVTAESIAQNIVRQVVERNPPVPVVNFISHNQYRYRTPGDATRLRFEGLLDALCAACDQAQVRLVGATLSQVVAQMKTMAPVLDPLVLEGAVFDAQGEGA